MDKTAIIERIKVHNRTILSCLEEINRVTKLVKEDAEGGFLPRYTSHIQQHVDRMVAASAKIEELNQLIVG